MASQEITTRRQYTDEDIEAGLQAMAIYAGKANNASEALEEAGNPIPPSTLSNWTRTHTARYHDIRSTQIAETRQRLAQRAEDVAQQAMDTAQLAIEKTREGLINGLNRNPADTVAKLSTAASLMTDKAQLLRGQATHRLEITNAQDVLAELATKLPNAHINTTAQEIPT